MIYTKLFEFQKKEITLVKDTNNPFFNSKYATLNQVLEKVRKPLADMNVLILQIPQEKGLKTILWDIDDASTIECFMPYVEVTTAQKLGSNNTYNRRYSLITLLGLEDEDDDGNSASGGTQEAPGRAKAPNTPKYEFVNPKAPVKANSDPLAVVCNCGNPAKRAMSKTVKNPNRWFLTCATKTCEYYKWEDELQAQGNQKATLDEETAIQYDE